MMDVVEEFFKLFRGRGDVRGSWEGKAVREPVTLEHFEKHLTSTNQSDWFGVYPNLGDKVPWGCIDIDGADFPGTYLVQWPDKPSEWKSCLEHPRYHRKDPQFHDWDAMLNLAHRLVDALAHKDVHGHIERTRNGYHVWVFPEETRQPNGSLLPLVPAADMRRALMAACKVCNYDPKEVNPKQEELPAGKVGNYVRLPYYGASHWESSSFGMSMQPDRYFLGEHDEELEVRQFLDAVALTPAANITNIARLWTPPTVDIDHDLDAGLEAEPIVRMLPGLAYTIWRDGPLPGKDRSSTLAHLAHLCAEYGLLPTQAFTVVKTADQRHGRKFADREDGDEHITNIVRHAYA